MDMTQTDATTGSNTGTTARPEHVPLKFWEIGRAHV